MTGKQLKNSILQWAIQGKLVPQDPNDEPASVLLEKIRVEKARLVKEGKLKKKDLEVKPIAEDEIPFEIPKSWEWVRLGEISTYSHTKKKVNASKANPYVWGLDLEDIEKGGKLLCVKTVEERKAIGDKTYFYSGDILYSKLRPYLLKILIAPKDGICTPEIIPFTCYGDISSIFIVNVLKSAYVDDYINSVTYGVKMPRVSKDTMTSLLIPLPPLAEQHRIVAKIEKLMPLVEKYGETQEALEEWNNSLPEKLKKSILQEAIQGKLVPQDPADEPASVLLERIREEKKKLVKEGKLKKKDLEVKPIEEDEIPFEIPKSWIWVRHNELFDISGGSQPPKSDFSLKEKDGYIRLYQIRDYGKNPLPVYIPISKASKITQKGDILLARYGGSLGKVFIAENGAYNVAMAKVEYLFDKCLLNHDYLFLYYNCKLYQDLVCSNNRSAQGGFNKEDISTLLFPLPPLAEQQRIVANIEELFAKIDNMKEVKTR